ncbi:dephospho-CoA kinase [Aquisalimonas sp. 2447]|uniref:dephospho-CoA kinase n=1 Tax=Aquisalimonas sp. 2447 TaxID=2740807 RepID=UPI00143246D4|nr:dephospho-CoA kinase [Aquisalimonas sp. 2447]QIT56266.1 dephospho-CoA kinase [Aquisalimonas sp. 2447]
MLIIGLTGGIASGKTTVSDLFAELGVPVVDADIAARRVVEPGQPALDELAAAFGQDVLTESGTLDRKRLRERAFADADLRQRLEAILHPRIHEHMEAELAACDGSYAIMAVPLLVEGELLHRVHRVLVVDVPEEVQIQRLMQRDGSSREQAQAMLGAQSRRDMRLQHADDIVDNTGSVDDLRRQIADLHQHYQAIAADRAAMARGKAEETDR